MIKIGITGQAGFLGTYLFNVLGIYSTEFERVPFEDGFFESNVSLRLFVKQCDVIVHLAAMNRHPDPHLIFETNLKLVNQLIEAMEFEQVKPHVLFASSTQEKNESEYGKSKLKGRELLEKWAKRNCASFTGMVIPNIFGPFVKPNYNSFIATFCHELTHEKTPNIIQDNCVRLIYISNLCNHIINKIRKYNELKLPIVEQFEVPYDFEEKVTNILSILEQFKNVYFEKGFIPFLKDNNELNLFNTFRSYINYSNYFPVKLNQNKDYRGSFTETIRLGIGGQVSFSTTLSGITRGNHYHTRKIERFTVIRGKAHIQLRKIGTREVLDFYLDGNEPSYVDMPIWYTHNITNIGLEELYTQFWINEWYNPEDGDTFFESV